MSLTALSPVTRTQLLQAVGMAEEFRRARGLEGEPAPPFGPALAAALYARWYSVPVTGLGRAAGPSPTRSTTPRLVDRLRGAHAASRRYEAGWSVRALHADGSVTVEKDGERLDLRPPDLVNVARPAAAVAPGDEVSVTRRRDHVDAGWGWWVTRARRGEARPGAVLRVYWNCPEATAERLVSRLTGVVEARGVRYTLKCPNDPALFARADAVVLYLERSDWHRIAPSLQAVHRGLADRLGDAVPALTLRLGRGVAVAQDPGGGRSFGESRCDAIAEAVAGAFGTDAAAGRAPTRDALLAAVLAGLRAHGIDPERPFRQWRDGIEVTGSW